MDTPLSGEEKQWQEHFNRKLEKVLEGGTYSTAFLDPRQLELAQASLRRYSELSYTVYGGHPQAERNALYIFPFQHQGALPPVKAIIIRWPGGNEKIGHRDLLGAVLGLGLHRDQVGDIFMLEEGGAAVMVMKSKAEYICMNLLQVGHLPVDCSACEPDQLPLVKERSKEINGTVASLRLDSVLSLGFGASRSKIVRLIKGGLVMVNWRPVDSPSLQLNEGDQLSLRGRGRLFISSVKGRTRKGRIHLKLKKYS
ncbi:MAG: YlmH/Sll1252 family protein [Bacillota bacterium]